MLSMSFAAAAVLHLGVIICGTYVGPDYRMRLDSNGRADVLYVDQSHATIVFTNVERDTTGIIRFSGRVVSSTVPLNSPTEHLRTDDIATVNYTNGTLIATPMSGRPIRTYHRICFQGYNQEPGQFTAC